MTTHSREWLTHLSTLGVLLTILAGGLVHATGSGLACPDWPLCFGQYFPAMEGAVLYEHSHRIIAGVTGVLVWVTGIVSFFDPESTSRQRGLYGLSMGLILVQALLGGLTVLWRLPDWVSTTHFVVAQATLACLVTLSWSTWRILRRPHDTSITRYVGAEHRWIGGVTLFLLSVQAVVGAWLRHIGSPGSPIRHACQFLPMCEPDWVQLTTSYYYMYYVWHRILAVLVTVAVVVMTWVFRDFRRRIDICYRLSWVAAIAVLVQVLLGVLTVRAHLAVVPATLHLAGADLLLITMIIINLELWTPEGLTRFRS
jgi:heme A synthase